MVTLAILMSPLVGRISGTLKAPIKAVSHSLYDNLTNMSTIRHVSQSAPASGSGRLVTERLSDRLAALLVQQLESPGMGPGSRMPTERQIAETHGVSRTVVREAVHQLKSRGLLVSRQGAGIFVADHQNRPLAFNPEVMKSVEAVVQVVEVRRVIEGEIAALAAQRAKRSQVATIRRKLTAIDAAARAGGDGVDEDLEFHRAIGDACGNPQFGQIVAFLEQYLRDAMRVTRANEARRMDFMEAVRSEHRAIYDAIAARDAAGARKRALEHLANGRRRLELGGLLKPSAVGRPSVHASAKPASAPLKQPASQPRKKTA
jgi:GntR family transcriptional repressor for pyruvate dehydrogenase complex